MRGLISFLSFALIASALLPSSGVADARTASIPPAAKPPLSPEVRQVLISIAPTWNSFQGKMMGFKRTKQGEWKPSFGPVPVLFGKNGMAWGIGVFGQEQPGRKKVENDKRTPAGVFAIGKVYTDDPTLPKGVKLPYHTVTGADAWVDDSSLPLYNQHVRVDLRNPPPWFEKERMRLGDFAYRWRVEIRHNADQPVAGMGSAIFFHIRRGVTRPSVGCTTMAEKDIVSMMQWLDPALQPHYAALPWEEYQQKWKTWGLPNPALLKKIAP